MSLINDSHTFIFMLMKLNQKLHIEAKKKDYILPIGTILICNVNNIDKLYLIYPSPDD